MALTAVVGAGVAYGIYAGEKQQTAQRQALHRQQDAQKQAVAAAGEEQRRAAMEEKLQRMKPPDVSSLLAFEQGFPSPNSAQTTVDPSRIKLGGSSLTGSNQPSLLGIP